MGSRTTRCGALHRWGWVCQHPERKRRGPIGRPGWRGARTATSGAQATTHEGRKTAVEYLVRDARITDAERITALLAGAAGAPQADARATLGAADLPAGEGYGLADGAPHIVCELAPRGALRT